MVKTDNTTEKIERKLDALEPAAEGDIQMA
jgi:hypothetical protein